MKYEMIPHFIRFVKDSNKMQKLISFKPNGISMENWLIRSRIDKLFYLIYDNYAFDKQIQFFKFWYKKYNYPKITGEIIANDSTQEYTINNIQTFKKLLERVRELIYILDVAEVYFIQETIQNKQKTNVDKYSNALIAFNSLVWFDTYVADNYTRL